MKYLTIIYFVALTIVSCSSGWNEEAKSIYRDSCTISPEYEEYCECTLEKVMKASPNIMDFESVEMDRITSECMYLIDEFIDNLDVEDLEEF